MSFFFSKQMTSLPITSQSPHATLDIDYKEILKAVCRTVFHANASIVTRGFSFSISAEQAKMHRYTLIRADGTLHALYYHACLTLPDGTRYESTARFPTIEETENCLCFEVMQLDARLSLDKDKAYYLNPDGFDNFNTHFANSSKKRRLPKKAQ